MQDAPTLAEACRDEAERQCALHGHVLTEDEDDETVCERCGETALYVEEPDALLCKHGQDHHCTRCTAGNAAPDTVPGVVRYTGSTTRW